MEIISESSEILERLRKEGKVTEVVMTGEQIKQWMDAMFKIKEESRNKQNQSWLDAKDVWLD
jgi:hypothetical protein